MTCPRVRGVVLAALLTAGCLVDVDKVSDPGPAFARARAEAVRVQGRPGPARRLNVLAWDRMDGELVRVSLPMWMVRKVDGHEDEDIDLDLGEAAEEGVARLRRRLRARDLEAAGLGILVEVEEEDGDQVLVWLS